MTSTRLSSGRSFLVENSLVSSAGGATASGMRDCAGFLAARGRDFVPFPSRRLVGVRAIGESPFGQSAWLHRNLDRWVPARKWALVRFLGRRRPTAGGLYQPAADARGQRRESPKRPPIL